MRHEKSQQARTFLRHYVNSNGELIREWQGGSGTADHVGLGPVRLVIEQVQRSIKQAGFAYLPLATGHRT